MGQVGCTAASESSHHVKVAGSEFLLAYEPFLPLGSRGRSHSTTVLAQEEGLPGGN